MAGFILIAIAAALALLAAFGVQVGSVNLGWLAVCFLSFGHMAGAGFPWRTAP